MIDWDDLRRRVEATYDADVRPSWPDPRPGRTVPDDDEYSRVTDPARYQIVQVRARAWQAELVKLPGVTAETIVRDDAAEQRVAGAPERCVRISSARPGTLDLILLEQDVPLSQAEGSLSVLRIGVQAPDLFIDALPDCGCDACDSGSSDLLRAIDEAVRRVVAGPLVSLRGSGWSAHWSPHGSSSSGLGYLTGPRPMDHDEAMTLGERLAAGQPVDLPAGTQAWVGRPWIPDATLAR